MNDCIFCDIISGVKPSTKLYEDEKTIAILDIFPVARGHILVIPKTHSRNLFDINEEDVSKVAITVTKICKALKQVLKCDGMNVLANSEKVAMQEIMHTHFHVIPRFFNDDIVFGASREPLKEDPALIAELSKELAH
jgi:histidine triad (HIT) family protein